MHGLPATFDATVFVGSTLDSVTFAVNVIHLAFDSGLSISVNARVCYRAEVAQVTLVDELPVRESRLMLLIGKAVSGAACDTNGFLTLELEDGGLIQVTDELSNFESYSITTPDGEIFV